MQKLGPDDPGRSGTAAQPVRFFILGAGHFGALAAQRLMHRYPAASFLVVDARWEALIAVRKVCRLPVHQDEAIGFLSRVELTGDLWIVPAVPVHVAFLWICSRLERSGNVTALPVSTDVDPQVPNPYRTATGTLYASFASWRCPDNCSEPDRICSYTGEPRAGDLYALLEGVESPGFKVVVVRSRQLAPGVGGYTGAHLLAALDTVRSRPGSCLIATSCRCHGVVDALHWESAPDSQ